jgi:hypothetical protein
MNELRDAIDRTGAMFEPPDDGLDDLRRRSELRRARRRVTAGTLAVAVATGGAIFALRTLPSSPSGPHPRGSVLATWAPAASTTPAPEASKGITCPTLSPDDQAPLLLSSTSGAPGSTIDVTGRFPIGGLWMQLWWNAGDPADTLDSPPWPPTGPDLHLGPAGPGPVVNLASVAGPATTGECSILARFIVPSVEPGTYKILWLFGAAADSSSQHPDDAFAIWGNQLTFQVTG